MVEIPKYQILHVNSYIIEKEILTNEPVHIAGVLLLKVNYNKNKIFLATGKDILFQKKNKCKQN